jgi:hypothetical protein
MTEVYARILAEVQDALDQESRTRREIRELIFPRLATAPRAPQEAGKWNASLEQVQRLHRGLLFNGGVEACDGNRHVHDTLPLTIYQIGVSLVSYSGNQGTWVHRLFRRDLRVRAGEKRPSDEALALLQRRGQRGALNQESQRDKLSNLAGRAIMSYAERAILAERSTAVWRIGHGSPMPYELLTGSGSLDLMIRATKVLRELIEGHQRFLFVASEPSDRLLLTVGQALNPLEYAIVYRYDDVINKTIENGHYRMHVSEDMTWDGQKIAHPHTWIRRFRDQVASKVVVGIYRASKLAPAQVFYAHADHVHLAAHLALADSVLQDHRGFPLLIDLADHLCGSVFGADSLGGPVTTAYTQADAPLRYLSERATRNR